MTTHWTQQLPTKPGWYACRWFITKQSTSPSEWPKDETHWTSQCFEFGSDPIANYPVDPPKTVTLTEEELEARIKDAVGAHPEHRWNVMATDYGITLCRSTHGAHNNCLWEHFASKETLDRKIREAVEREREEVLKEWRERSSPTPAFVVFESFMKWLSARGNK